MGDKNVEPVRNPTRHNKTIKQSGYKYDEDQEAEKKFESEDDLGRSGENNPGESDREKTSNHGGRRVHPKVPGSHHAQEQKE